MNCKNLLNGVLLAPLMAALLGTAGCGGAYTTAVSGTWKTPAGATPPSGYTAYSATLNFGALTDVTYSLTDTVSGTGSLGGCQETVSAMGTYLLQDTKLLVVLSSGTISRTGCTKTTDNVAQRAMTTTDEALYTALVSGNYAVSGTTLTIGITVMGIASMTTYMKQ